MNEVKETTEVALLGRKDVPTMLEKVTEEIKLIKGELPDSPNTSVELPGYGRIVTINSVDQLIKAASSVISRADAYKLAAKEVVPEGMKIPVFKLGGATKAQWIEDIKGRIIIVGNQAKLDMLYKVKGELEQNLSAEAKLANSLSKIQEMFENA